MPVKKTSKKTAPKEDNSDTTDAATLFGVTDKKADEIISLFKHAQIDNDTWTATVNEVKGKLKTNAEFAYLGWVVARIISKQEDPIAHLMEHVLSHRGK